MKTALLMLLLCCTALLRAEPVPSALKPGDTIPDVKLRTEEDKEVALRELVSAKPTVLIFYRGGWCPYCMTHLQALAGIEKDLLDAGVQLLAISMDQPAKLRATPHHEKLGYRLLSDSSATAVKAFGIAFTADDKTLAALKSYHIDIEAASGNEHHILPHPAVFLVGADGTILFVHTDTNYKVRLDAARILETAKQAVMAGKKM